MARDSKVDTKTIPLAIPGLRVFLDGEEITTRFKTLLSTPQESTWTVIWKNNHRVPVKLLNPDEKVVADMTLHLERLEKND